MPTPATATPPPRSVEAGVRAGATAAVSAGARDGGAAGALPVPDAELATPATGSLGAGRHDVFSLSGNDMTHRYRLRGGSWRREVNRGGTLASQPVVVSWGPGRLDAFARGADDTLWHRWWKDGTWSRWSSLGGVLTSAPAVTSWGPGRLDVFVRSTRSDRLYRKSYAAGSGWSAWRSLDGVATASPAAASRAPGRINLVIRGTDGAAHVRSYSTTSGWSAWRSLGGRLAAQPALAASTSRTLDLVALDTDGRLVTRQYVPGKGWTGWSTLGERRFASGPSATAIADDVVVTAKGTDGYVHRAVRAQGATAWSRWRSIDPYLPFRRLATWVDTLDYASLTPETAVADMDARGVRTLFLSTARFNSGADFYDEALMGRWLDAAHQHGIRVVGWYVPAYGDMERDVRRSVAIGHYVSPGGQRFDALGVDIERFASDGEVDHATFNASVVPHLRAVRARTTAVVAAIVPSPFGTDPGNRWEGFPWTGVGANAEVVVPMVLWSFRGSSSDPFAAAEVYAWVREQVDRTQALTGRRVHVEGGVPTEGRTPVTSERITAFVDASRDAGAIGASQYDYEVTSSWMWPFLDDVNG